MDLEYLQLPVYLVSLLAVMGFIRMVTKDTDDDVNQDRIKTLSNYLLNVTKTKDHDWLPDFSLVFDNFFGLKVLSWKCFFRQLFISAISLLILTTLVTLFSSQHEFDKDSFVAIGFFSIIGVFCNAFVDYFSLVQTRLLLGTRLNTALKIIIDFILTTLTLPLGLVFLGLVSGQIPLENFINNTIDIYLLIYKFILHWEDDLLVNILFCLFATTYLTSIWLWLHGLAVATIKVSLPVKKVISLLNIEHKPIRAIGTTINILIGTSGILLSPIVFLD